MKQTCNLSKEQFAELLAVINRNDDSAFEPRTQEIQNKLDYFNYDHYSSFNSSAECFVSNFGSFCEFNNIEIAFNELSFIFRDYRMDIKLLSNKLGKFFLFTDFEINFYDKDNTSSFEELCDELFESQIRQEHTIKFCEQIISDIQDEDLILEDVITTLQSMKA